MCAIVLTRDACHKCVTKFAIQAVLISISLIDVYTSRSHYSPWAVLSTPPMNTSPITLLNIMPACLSEIHVQPMYTHSDHNKSVPFPDKQSVTNDSVILRDATEQIAIDAPKTLPATSKSGAKQRNEYVERITHQAAKIESFFSEVAKRDNESNSREIRVRKIPVDIIHRANWIANLRYNYFKHVALETLEKFRQQLKHAEEDDTQEIASIMQDFEASTDSIMSATYLPKRQAFFLYWQELYLSQGSTQPTTRTARSNRATTARGANPKQAWAADTSSHSLLVQAATMAPGKRARPW